MKTVNHPKRSGSILGPGNQANVSLFYVWILCIFSFLSACRSNISNEEVKFYDLDGKGFVPFKEYVFWPGEEIQEEVLDETRWSIKLIVRYTDSCRISEIPLNIEYLWASEDSIKNQNICLKLFQPEHNESPKGDYGVFQTQEFIAADIQLSKESFVAVSTNISNSQGIISLGISYCRDNAMGVGKKGENLKIPEM